MWMIFAFLTAIFRSIQDLLSKKISVQVDASLIAWGWAVFSLPYLFVFASFEGWPDTVDISFWRALGVSTFILSVATILYFKAIKESDLSISLPMLAFTPLFLLFTSPLMLGEFPGGYGVLGVVLIVGGAYVLNIKDLKHGMLKPFQSLLTTAGSRYMLTVALLYSVGANVDKIGVMHSKPITWIFALNTSIAIVHTIRLSPNWRKYCPQFKGAWKFFILIGFFNAMALFFQMKAITLTIVPYLIAIKRTSVMMTTIIGVFYFKEKDMKSRLLGVGLMLLGVFMICFFN